MKPGIYCAIALGAVMALTGCHGQAWVEGPASQCTTADQASAMKTAQDVLVNMGFRIEKYDTDSGIIRTKPLSGGQFFEVWRHDNTNGFDAAESNLHSIERIVEISFTQSEGKTCMLCTADVKRLSMPEKEVTGSSNTYSMFTTSSRNLMTTQINPGQARQMAWIDMGSDAKLAAKITGEVAARAHGSKGEQ